MSQNRLRWAVFSSSVVSAVDNPDAYVLRALSRYLSGLGHEAMFFEERGNPPVRALLHRSGARALVDFREHYPDVDYRTVDPQTGFLLVEWLTRTLGTIDVVLVQTETPTEMAVWIGRLTRNHLQTYLFDTGLNSWPVERSLVSCEPVNYSGVFVGSEQLAERYRADVPNGRIYEFGPMPSTTTLSELSSADMDAALEPIVERIAGRIIQAAADNRERRLQFGKPSPSPNGRSG